MKCPQCNSIVEDSNINIQTDIGKCQSCQHIFKISLQFDESQNSAFDLYDPPKGAWIRTDVSHIIVGATTRSLWAFFLVPFMVVWSGGALGGIYGTQIVNGKFNLMMLLIGIPFILGSVLFWSLALMAIWGKVEITINKSGGKTFTGLGKFGFSKSFLWEDVSRIRENDQQNNFRYPGKQGKGILIEGKRRITVGTGLSEGRLYYLFSALNKIHSNVKANEYS
ncbi:MAG: hypothetical protein AB8B53_06670 [Flavobacteriales bacterium]